ncbi:hypothetical protein FVO80_23880 [Mycobacterium avium subsp. hominissuis]|nr:hypothetical protein [Mycobacterium avium subsp. hominissuis]MBZ4594938.1 hypothetical protein [Mycobacterium avium subsp. hominissuis]MBZ4637676.1 hypothetical protein [Mycobacterium avium subsp. hominissuis]
MSDTWVRRGLGATAARVYELLTDEAVPVKVLASRVGLDRSTVTTHLNRLFEVGLAGHKTEGRSRLWFKGYAPLDLVAETLGVSGTLERHVQKIELMQADQRALREMSYTDRQVAYRKRRDAGLRRRAEQADSLAHLPTDEPDTYPDPFTGPDFDLDAPPSWEMSHIDWPDPEIRNYESLTDDGPHRP